MELEGKVALVTGAGSGIGRSIAEAFAAEGAAVVLDYLGRSQDALQLAEQLKAAGGRSLAVEADIARADQVRALVEQAVTAFGRLDVLVNNAGIERATPLLEIAEGDWDQVVGVDLKGAFLCLQACAQVMKGLGGGSIINISSVHEDRPFPGFATYCAAKGGLRMLMRDAALELAPHGIRVNNIAPGAIATPINLETMQDTAKMKRLQEIIPLGRMGRPQEVAAVAVFLASERASYVTGSTYYVDGGMVCYAEAL